MLAPSALASVHTVDFFRSIIDDPYLFGRVAANHALSDCHAMNAPATGALAVAVVPYGLDAKVEEVGLIGLSVPPLHSPPLPSLLTFPSPTSLATLPPSPFSSRLALRSPPLRRLSSR